MKKRILFVVPLPPPVHGSAMMCQYIKDSCIINDASICDYINLSTSRRMDEIGKWSIKKIFRFIGSYFAVLFKLLTHHYDVCYLAITCHGMGFLKDAPYVLLCKVFGCKVIIHQHNKGMANDVNRWPYSWLFPLIYKNTTVILLSWKLYPDIEAVVTREQVVICPNGISDIDFVPQKHCNNIPNLLFLSNLIESKGVFDLLDALKILNEKGYTFVCNFVGGETKEIDVHRFQAEVHMRKLDGLVFYRGSKYGQEKYDIFSKSDVLISPTYNDCFPLVLLEAMRQELAVITTDEGATTDIVSDGITGLIAKKRCPEDIAVKISLLLSNPEKMIEMGHEGRKRFLESFTIENYEKRMSEIVNNEFIN